MVDPFQATRRAIRRHRIARGLTQQAVADALQMNRASYNQMENGPRKIMALELAAICEFWGVPYARLFPQSSFERKN